MDFDEILIAVMLESFAGEGRIPGSVDRGSQVLLLGRRRAIEDQRQDAAGVVGMGTDGISSSVLYEYEIGREGHPFRGVSESLFDERAEFIAERLNPLLAMEAGDEFSPKHQLEEGEDVEVAFPKPMMNLSL